MGSKGKNKDRKKKKARKAAKKEDKKDEKKKAKKEKKKARKAKKKARKQKKKSKKERKSNRKAKGTATARTSCMNATCIDNAVTYMKQLKLAVKNFDKQYNRITVKSKQTSGKPDKNDEFAPYLIKLSETGGGNVSNLSCNGEGKGKGRGLKKKNKKKRKNLKKSDKKSAGKKNGDKKKKGKKNGAKRSKKDGKGKKRKNGAKKNGKKQKGLKKKSRKNKSKDGKGKNKARKQKKKSKKERKSNRKAKGTATARTSCMNATCIDNAVTYMKQLKLAVKNFDKQYNRITVKSKQTSGKSDKNDEFAPYLIKLSETGGGNVSNLSCNGEYNTGATNLQTLYDNIASCETKINDSCNANMPAVNQTFMDACKATMDLFGNKTSDAIDFNLKGNGADACKIWESSEVAAASAMLKDCSLKSTEKEYTAASKSCLKSFSW